MTPARVAHPAVWSILYLPFGALSGFVGVPMTYYATKHGLSISEGALLTAASLLMAWLKWSWAPAVDVTLTPKVWYVIATTATALGIVLMTAIPMSPDTLKWLLIVIAVTSLLNSIVGMAIEAIMAAVTTPEERGRTSAWFQAGNLGGAGIGGGVGMTLFRYLPEGWMVGVVVGGLLLCCCLALRLVPDVRSPSEGGETVAGATRDLLRSVGELLRTKGGLLAAAICFLPIGTGAAGGTLTQAAVAEHWGATAWHVELVQGYLSAPVTVLGCFAGGYLCDRIGRARLTYAGIGVAMALVAAAITLGPATPLTYMVGVVLYLLVVGAAYAAFTALVLDAIGRKGGATKYNLYASLSNFPIWWLGILLGLVAERYGKAEVLLVEAGLGLLAIVLFFGVTRAVSATRLPDHLDEPAPVVED